MFILNILQDFTNKNISSSQHIIVKVGEQEFGAERRKDGYRPIHLALLKGDRCKAEIYKYENDNFVRI